MTPVNAAIAGAVISGVAMYAVGARAPQADAFQTPALVQTVDAIPAAQPGVHLVSQRASSTPRRTVYRQPAPAARPAAQARERVVVEERDDRPWSKTALIIGGAAASGAGVGAVVDGKKGALIGAAIGGGAASIYEATRR